jgi:hypothetical protein
MISSYSIFAERALQTCCAESSSWLKRLSLRIAHLSDKSSNRMRIFGIKTCYVMVSIRFSGRLIVRYFSNNLVEYV